MEVNVSFSIDLKTLSKKYCDITVDEFKETYTDEKVLKQLIEELLEEKLYKFGIYYMYKEVDK